MRADSRFGGHFVQGHVDATADRARACGPTASRTGSGSRCRTGWAPLFVPKGSVAVNGVSLTVAALADGRFDVMIIPFTWEHTPLADLRPVRR